MNNKEDKLLYKQEDTNLPLSTKNTDNKRKKKKCIICRKPTYGKLCRDCFENK